MCSILTNPKKSPKTVSFVCPFLLGAWVDLDDAVYDSAGRSSAARRQLWGQSLSVGYRLISGALCHVLSGDRWGSLVRSLLRSVIVGCHSSRLGRRGSRPTGRLSSAVYSGNVDWSAWWSWEAHVGVPVGRYRYLHTGGWLVGLSPN